MPTVRPFSALDANGQVSNVLEGSEFQYLGQAARVTVAIAQKPTAAATVGKVNANISFGSRIIMSNAPIPQNDNGQPRITEEIIAQDVVLPGELIRIALAEVAGDPVEVQTLVKIDYS